jgi:Asp-tRNA(Asn)/Glu-tRNA(Gln) amidotransferase A subunit family amidase
MVKDHYPDRDCFAAAKLKAAGAIFIGKATLGELGAGDTHGSLFGSTRNVYDLERTAGGSSGGSGAAVSANFCAVAIGQEGFASIRRPAIWNGVAGMRPTAGLVSRGGVYAGWPTIIGSLGPMARTVEDLARVLECMVGFDPQDPVTALGHGKAGQGFSGLLDKDALKGVRIGVLREPMGFHTDTSDPDFDRVTEVFDAAVADLAAAGAVIVDPIVIADLKALLATRARVDADDEASFDLYVSGSAASPFANRQEAMASPLFDETMRGVKQRWLHKNTLEQHHAYLRAREILMMNLHAVMAEHGLDAIVHKAVEHTPTLIRDGVNPPIVDQRGAPHLNTFLTFVPSVVVPAGFTITGLPAGITFLGRPYADAAMLRLAYAYEQATKKRMPPKATP